MALSRERYSLPYFFVTLEQFPMVDHYTRCGIIHTAANFENFTTAIAC